MFDWLTGIVKKIQMRRAEYLFPERKYRVTLENSYLLVINPTGELFKAPLNCLEKVEIITTDAGPWVADVWYEFSFSSGSVCFPQGATGDKAAVDYLLVMPGVDELQFILAMSSSDNARFLCWQKTE